MASNQTRKNLGEILSIGAMAMGQGMTGQPYLTNYQNMQMKRQEAEQEMAKWKSELALKNRMLDSQLGFQNYIMDKSGENPNPTIGVDSSGQPIITSLSIGSTGKPTAKFDTKIDQYSRASKLRQEFQDLPEVKTYNEVYTKTKELEGLLNSALKSKSSQGKVRNFNALDQGMITLFNKITDPQSVVRESEYARVGENLPTVNKIDVALNKWQTGQQLTDDDRKALVEAAKIMTDEMGKTYNQRYASYGELAEKGAGVKKDDVLGAYKEHSPFIKVDSSKVIPPEVQALSQQLGIKIKSFKIRNK